MDKRFLWRNTPARARPRHLRYMFPAGLCIVISALRKERYLAMPEIHSGRQWSSRAGQERGQAGAFRRSPMNAHTLLTRISEIIRMSFVQTECLKGYSVRRWPPYRRGNGTEQSRDFAFRQFSAAGRMKRMFRPRRRPDRTRLRSGADQDADKRTEQKKTISPASTARLFLTIHNVRDCNKIRSADSHSVLKRAGRPGYMTYSHQGVHF